MASEDNRLGDVTGQSEAGQTEANRAGPRTQREGQTSRLLERVGHLPSSLSGLLTRIDYGPRGAQSERSGLSDDQQLSCHAGPCLSDAIPPSSLLGASPKRGERSHKDSAEPTSSTPVFSSMEGLDTRRKRTSPSESSARKRKPTYFSGDAVAGDVRPRGKEGNARQQESLHSSMYSVLLEALPKVTGVFFDKSQERWVSSVYMGGRNIKSYFPVCKHGFLQARSMAISQRLSQVAHKGVSRAEMDSLTPAGLTIEALLEVLRIKGVSPHETATVSPPAPGQKSKSVTTSAELEADVTAEQPKSYQATSSVIPYSGALQHPRLDAKGSCVPSRVPLLLSRSACSLPWNSISSPSVSEASAGERCGNSSTISSVYNCDPSDERCVESGCRGFFSTLHSYAAFEFSPWEKGVTWDPDTISWAVHSALRRECVVYVPVRLEAKHKKTIEAVGEWLAKAGDIRTRAKVALELTHIGRALTNKTQSEGPPGTESYAACVGDALGVKEEEQLPSDTFEERQHADKADKASSSRLSAVQPLSLTDANREIEQASERSGSAAEVGDRPQTSGCGRSPTILVEGEEAARDALEKAAEAVFRAVGEAHAEAVELLRRLNEVRNDDELVAALRSLPEERDEEGAFAGRSSSAGLALALQDLSSQEESTCIGGCQESAVRADRLLRRSLLAREASGLKLWSQGVNWGASCAKWFPLARLAGGSCVSRGFRASSEGGTKEGHSLVPESQKRTTENMGEGLQEERGISLFSSTSSHNQSDLPTNCSREQVFELGGSEQQQRSSKSTSTALANGEVSPLSLPNLLQQRALLESPIQRPDKPLRAAVESTSHHAHCSGGGNRPAVSEPHGAANARLSAGDIDPGPLEAEREMMLQHLNLRRKDRVDGEHIDQIVGGLRRAQLASHAATRVNQEVPVAEEDEVQLLRLQWQAVRRCLLDLRDLSTALFVPDVGEQKAAVVDTHLSLVSTCWDLREILIYVRLFESALLEGQLPSQMSVETQRVFFGALVALAEARKLQSR
ncbi:hypothetical protein ACSSS7_001957 [Eimeria intestinalis]